MINRFSFVERLVHWMVGMSFMLLLLTGFAFSYPSLFWITTLVGGGPSARELHPWMGLMFVVGLAWMFAFWAREMVMTGTDGKWLRAVQYYATQQHEKVPAAGKYNAGQKLFFWVQSLLGILFLLSGVPLWLPESFTSLVVTSMRLVHYGCALGGGLFVIVHIYLGTIAYPGTARGMIDGKVTRKWAQLHHPLWHKEHTEL